jgi:tetratricopeptide (TPR) repeat protein
MTSCEDPKRKAIDLKLEGIDLSYKREFSKAIETLTRSLKYNEKDPETYFYIGTSYYELNKKDSAFAYYTKAVGVDPKYGQAYVNRGRMYKYDRNDRENACRDWLKAESLGVKSVKEETKFCK